MNQSVSHQRSCCQKIQNGAPKVFPNPNPHFFSSNSGVVFNLIEAPASPSLTVARSLISQSPAVAQKLPPNPNPNFFSSNSCVVFNLLKLQLRRRLRVVPYARSSVSNQLQNGAPIVATPTLTLTFSVVTLVWFLILKGCLAPPQLLSSIRL
jgi:hypothetical protein